MVHIIWTINLMFYEQWSMDHDFSEQKDRSRYWHIFGRLCHVEHNLCHNVPTRYIPSRQQSPCHMVYILYMGYE